MTRGKGWGKESTQQAQTQNHKTVLKYIMAEKYLAAFHLSMLGEHTSLKTPLSEWHEYKRLTAETLQI
eukprot:4480629-Amphidinium_carterae.1